VLVEKYLTRPRHIEIQVFADSLGNCVYLFERDCSVQRRHQKVLEEAPAPGLSEQRRAEMGQAAVAAARAVGYVGAGTVEFIADYSTSANSGAFYFMEMNTRLQVEHPVTEMITGLDLVEWQLRVAAGEALPLRQDQLRIHGHALEARIYAENPDKGFLPSIGRLQHLRTPPAVEFALGLQDGTPAAVRIDSGVREGDAISPFYDPMIAKLIVWGVDREAALRTMAQALAQYQVVGLATNIGFLQRLIADQAFAGADLDTGLIERRRESLFPPAAAVPLDALALATAALLMSEQAQQQSRDPWSIGSGWRMNASLLRSLQFKDEAQPYALTLEYASAGQHWRLHSAEQIAELSLPSMQDGWLQLALDGRRVQGNVVRSGEIFHVFCGGLHRQLSYLDPLSHAGDSEAEGGRLTAPMPGKIVAVLVQKGAVVEKGAPLLIMEAMKMEHTIAAPAGGTVEDVLYLVGDQVSEGAQLLEFKAA
jgi:3-methylcrotonyl-CoA carboxylase alpha subunit